jgi:hypothetical protein
MRKRIEAPDRSTVELAAPAGSRLDDGRRCDRGVRLHARRYARRIRLTTLTPRISDTSTAKTRLRPSPRTRAPSVVEVRLRNSQIGHRRDAEVLLDTPQQLVADLAVSIEPGFPIALDERRIEGVPEYHVAGHDPGHVDRPVLRFR